MATDINFVIEEVERERAEELNVDVVVVALFCCFLLSTSFVSVCRPPERMGHEPIGLQLALSKCTKSKTLLSLLYLSR